MGTESQTSIHDPDFEHRALWVPLRPSNIESDSFSWLFNLLGGILLHFQRWLQFLSERLLCFIKQRVQRKSLVQVPKSKAQTNTNENKEHYCWYYLNKIDPSDCILTEHQQRSVVTKNAFCDLSITSEQQLNRYVDATITCLQISLKVVDF